MKILKKFYEKHLKGKDFSEEISEIHFRAFLTFFAIIGVIDVAVLTPLYEHECIGYNLMRILTILFVTYFIVGVALCAFILIFPQFADFRTGRGIGNYDSDTDYYDPKWYTDTGDMRFPLSVSKSRPKAQIINFKHTLDDDITKVYGDEIYPALIELYKKADFNKETRNLYKMSIPEVKKMYELLSAHFSSFNETTDPETKAIIKNNFIESKDDIIAYIKNIQKPIDKILDGYQDIKMSENELKKKQDFFLNIKTMNQLHKSDLDLLSDKYNLTSEENSNNSLMQKKSP